MAMKTLFFLILFAPLLAISKNGHLGLPPFDLKKEYQYSGDLVQIKIIPGDKETKLFVVGKETARLKFDKLDVHATLIIGNNEKTITFSRQKDHFSTTDTLSSGDLNLKLHLLDSKKSEQLKIKLINN